MFGPRSSLVVFLGALSLHVFVVLLPLFACFQRLFVWAGLFRSFLSTGSSFIETPMGFWDPQPRGPHELRKYYWMYTGYNLGHHFDKHKLEIVLPPVCFSRTMKHRDFPVTTEEGYSPPLLVAKNPGNF